MSYFSAVIGRQGTGWRALDVDVEDVDDLDELAQHMTAACYGGGPVIAVLEREDSWFALVRVDPGSDEDDEPRVFVSDLEATRRSQYAALLAPVGDVELDEYAELRVPVLPEPVLDDEEDELEDPEDGLEVVGAVVRPSPPAVVRAPDVGSDGSGRSDRSGAAGPISGSDMLPDDGDGPSSVEASGEPDVEVDVEPEEDEPELPSWAGDPGLLDDLGLSARELVDLVVESSADPGAVLADVGERCGFDDQLDALR